MMCGSYRWWKSNHKNFITIFLKNGARPRPHTNGIWVGAMGITGKIAVTAASGMSGLSALVQYPVNQRRTCDFWRFSTVFRALKVFSGLHFDLFPAMVHWLLEECQQTRHTRQSCDRDLSSDLPSAISYTAWGGFSAEHRKWGSNSGLFLTFGHPR